MGTWYGPGGRNSEAVTADSNGGAPARQPGSRFGSPCPNGVLLTSNDQEFQGTKMMDAMGRTWGCPGVVDTTVNTDTTTETQTAPVTGGSTTGDGTSGLWGMSPELMSLYQGLLSNATGLLNGGFDKTAFDYAFGPGFEAIKGGGAARANSIQEGLSRSGMLDTGAGLGMMNANSMDTGAAISDLLRKTYMDQIAQKNMNTQLALSIFGGGLGGEQITESLNAARRGEANDFWNQMMQLLATYRG